MSTLERDNSVSNNGFDPSATNLDCFGSIDDVISSGHDPTLSESNIEVECDYFDGVFEYIKQMLMEEDDLDDRPCMFQDSSALQAAEKAFCDSFTADVVSHSPSCNEIPSSSVDQIPNNSLDHRGEFDDFIAPCGLVDNQVVEKDLGENIPYRAAEKDPVNGLKGKRNHFREDGVEESVEEGRSSKQFAGYTDQHEEIEKYDKALLCQVMNPGFYDDPPPHMDKSLESKAGKKYPHQGLKRGRPRASEKQVNIKEFVDLRTLLTHCAQATASYDRSTAYELLKQIRHFSSPYGDATERLAHYFGNGLEARLAGTGIEIYTALSTRRISASDILKAYQVYVTACPYKRMSNIFAGKSIGKLTRRATTIHIIDFGILYGFQWPCFIQGISLKPGGPPKLRITGIDFPQPGFRPAERVEETGRRLGKFCKRFNVPFEYNAIVKKWESISLEDLNIDENDTTIVNCLYRLRHIPDETLEEYSPRDIVLDLIKKINPTIFLHGVVNGTFNSPLFITRFREALFHFSSLFDMLDATVTREDQERLLFEKAFLGRDAMNVIACEGTERVERPETYKQWQVRNRRAGFKQISLNRNIMREIRSKVRLSYHKDFLVDEDSNWMLQGWKGRVIYALSCWKPVND